MEKISVIVPVYKVEAYLDKCVQSIVDQTYKNLEIILVDDGSPDNCPTMCDKWAAKDSRIKVIHKKNGGLSDARNAGIEVATGKLLGFVDSDDWIEPEFYNILWSAMHDTNADLAGCSYREVFDDNDVISNITSEYSIVTNEKALEDLTNGIGFRAVAWNKLYRKHLFSEIRYPVGQYHEDEFVTYKILDAANGLVYVDSPLYCYRQRSQSIMSTISPKHLDCLEAYTDRLMLLQNKYPRLYLKDKRRLSVTCVSFYRSALVDDPKNIAVYRKRILECRKSFSFDMQDFKIAPVRDWPYMLFSRWGLPLFSKILNIRRKI